MDEIIDIEKIYYKLNTQGYAFFSHTISLEDYELIASQLGRIINKDDIKIDSRFKAYSTSAEKIDFHNDFSGADYIGWYCIEPEEINGETLLVDMTPVLNNLTYNEIILLSQLNIPTPTMREVIQQPLIQKTESFIRIYYLPWIKLNFISQEQEKAFLKFRTLYDEIIQKNVIAIKLKKGQFFFINNARMVHGRKQLEKNSKRWLKRIWIARQEWDNFSTDQVKKIRLNPQKILNH